MFEATLSAQLKRIFRLAKVTYDLPGESMEQEGIFIDVETARTRLVDKRQIAKVTGTIRIFANADKMPFGYVSKCLAEADPEDTRGLVFFDFEKNRGRIRNIVERTVEFLYLFDSQYDPNVGTLTSINLSIAES